MTGPIAIVRQGESFKFRFELCPDCSVSGWVCNIQVKQFTSDTSLIDRTIQPNNTLTAWVGTLTSDETQGLTKGLYRLIGLLTNATTDQEIQSIIRFNVTGSFEVDELLLLAGDECGFLLLSGDEQSNGDGVTLSGV